MTEFDLFVSTLIHPDATLIPEVSRILKDESPSSMDKYDQPICDGAKPKYFELDVIDQLSVSSTFFWLFVHQHTITHIL